MLAKKIIGTTLFALLPVYSMGATTQTVAPAQPTTTQAPPPAPAQPQVVPKPSAVAPATQRVFPTTLQLGTQTWNLGFKNEDANVQLAEYVTNNETVNNWKQLFTFQKFKFVFPAEATPVKFADGEIAHLKKMGYNPVYTVVSSNANEAIIEFRITTPQPDQQDEIQRVIRTPDSHFIVLHYVVRKSDMGELERAKWLNIIKTFNVDF